MSSSEKTVQADANNTSEKNAGAPILQTALEKISGAAGPTANYISVGAHRAGEALVSAATKANDVLGAAGEQLNDFQNKVTEDCRTYVRARPITAIGIALGAGFLLSTLLGRGKQQD